MQVFVIITMVVVCTVEYVVRTLGLPREVMLVPEGLSAIALLIVAIRLPRNRFTDIDPRYLAVFSLLLLHLVASIIVNGVPPGVIVSAARIYLKAIPFFFLPLLIPMTEKNLKWQLLAIAGVCLIQFPIAWEQRSHDMFKGSLTGDRTVGTLAISSIMSVFLCCAAAVALGLYLKQKLKFWMLLAFLALTLPATMINETKGTLFIAPLAFMIPVFMAGEGKGGAFKRNATMLLLVAGFLCAFIPTYDYYIRQRWGYGLIEFFQMQGRVEGYLAKGSELGSKQVGRVDSLILPFKATLHDYTQSAFGFGPGNVSRSSLGPQFTGAQYPRYGDLVGPSASFLLWEIGWVGLGLVLWTFWMIFRDALVARKADGIAGGIALGWIAVTTMMGISFFYNLPTNSNAMSYLFWYFSGVVVATAMRVRAESGAQQAPPALRERRVRPRVQSSGLGIATDSLRTARRR